MFWHNYLVIILIFAVFRAMILSLLNLLANWQVFTINNCDIMMLINNS